jgi:hypothetical protein
MEVRGMSWTRSNDDALHPIFRPKKREDSGDSSKTGQVEVFRGTPVRALIRQGFLFPATILVRLLGMGALLSRN